MHTGASTQQWSRGLTAAGVAVHSRPFVSIHSIFFRKGGVYAWIYSDVLAEGNVIVVDPDLRRIAVSKASIHGTAAKQRMNDLEFVAPTSSS
jgi:hypothetical protein